MFCPRCNTELSDSASICSQCGSPVSAGPTTSSPSERPQASTFSYLPAGAPQWPTTATLNIPYGIDPRNAQAAYEPDDSLDELESGRPARKPFDARAAGVSRSARAPADARHLDQRPR